MCSISKRIGDVRLSDFKTLFDRPGFYRYHFKAVDQEFGMVKEEVSPKKLRNYQWIIFFLFAHYAHVVQYFIYDCFIDFNRRCNPARRRWKNCRLGGRRLNNIWSKWHSKQNLVGFTKGINIYTHTIVPLWYFQICYYVK